MQKRSSFWLFVLSVLADIVIIWTVVALVVTINLELDVNYWLTIFLVPAIFLKAWILWHLSKRKQ